MLTRCTSNGGAIRWSSTPELMGWTGMWRHFKCPTICCVKTLRRLYIFYKKPETPQFTWQSCFSWSTAIALDSRVWKVNQIFALTLSWTWIHYCYISTFIVPTTPFSVAIYIRAQFFFVAGGRSNNQVSEVRWAMGEEQATSAQESRLSCISPFNKSDFSAKSI